MNFNLFFLFGKKKEGIDIKDLDKAARSAMLRESKEKPKKKKVARRIAVNLAIISNHLSEIMERSREATKEEGSQDITRELYVARRNVQAALEKIKK